MYYFLTQKIRFRLAVWQQPARCLAITIYLLLLSGLEARAQSQHNFEHDYHTGAYLQADFRVTETTDSCFVYIKLFNRLFEEPFEALMQISTDSAGAWHYDEQAETEDLSQYLSHQEGRNSYYLVRLPRSASGLLMLNLAVALQVQEFKPYIFSLPVQHPMVFNRSALRLTDEQGALTHFEPYLQRGAPFRLKSTYPDDSLVTLYHYEQAFLPAMSPMATTADVQKALNHHRVLQLPLDSVLRLQEPGLYFAQTDTTQLAGLAFRVEPESYPRYEQPEQLVRPLVYLSTRSERERLFGTADKKEALDAYWLKLATTRDKARRLIKNYYKQVTRANSLFSNYKPGWQTDPGMVYIIFGKPDEVERTMQGEIWRYKQKGFISKITFTFVRVKNIFTDQHLELIRDPAYKSNWFGMVSAWRKGLITINE